MVWGNATRALMNFISPVRGARQRFFRGLEKGDVDRPHDLFRRMLSWIHVSWEHDDLTVQLGTRVLEGENDDEENMIEVAIRCK
jgi:hypothetical protein